MAALKIEPIVLDYLGAASGNPKLLTNLSAAAADGEYLWTASDEGRTIECLKRDGSGYRLHDQVKLDDICKELPEDPDPDSGKLAEADIESLSICGKKLWICGSHCRVRAKPKKKPGESGDIKRVVPHFKTRPSRHLFGYARIKGDGGELAKMATHLPFTKAGSLRDLLGKEEFLDDFVRLPSKENGLDIEGLSVIPKNRVFFGLRGPLADSFAIVVEAKFDNNLKLAGDMALHFIDLGGLGVRDLAAYRDDILILAGPVSGLRSPFRIYRWHPLDKGREVQSAELLYPKPDQPHASKVVLPDMARADADEHPEGICLLKRGEQEGLLVLYDNPRGERINGSRYTADWISVI
jgi:hypothetical protein